MFRPISFFQTTLPPILVAEPSLACPIRPAEIRNQSTLSPRATATIPGGILQATRHRNFPAFRAPDRPDRPEWLSSRTRTDSIKTGATITNNWKRTNLCLTGPRVRGARPWSLAMPRPRKSAALWRPFSDLVIRTPEHKFICTIVNKNCFNYLHDACRTISFIFNTSRSLVRPFLICTATDVSVTGF